MGNNVGFQCPLRACISSTPCHRLAMPTIEIVDVSSPWCFIGLRRLVGRHRAHPPGHLDFPQTLAAFSSIRHAPEGEPKEHAFPTLPGRVERVEAIWANTSARLAGPMASSLPSLREDEGAFNTLDAHWRCGAGWAQLQAVERSGSRLVCCLVSTGRRTWGSRRVGGPCVVAGRSRLRWRSVPQARRFGRPPTRGRAGWGCRSKSGRSPGRYIEPTFIIDRRHREEGDPAVLQEAIRQSSQS